MAKIHEIRKQITIDASSEKLWEVIADHEGMVEWAKEVAAVTVITKGSPDPMGVGLHRTVKFKDKNLPVIAEEILVFNAPKDLHYTLYKGIPGLKKHMGKMRIDPINDNQSVLHWDVDFEFKRFHPIAAFVPKLIKTFSKSLEETLDQLKHFVEQGEALA